MDTLMRKCQGCGAVLQTDDEQAPGFVPEQILQREHDKGIICKRCHRIRHYNEILKVTLDEKKFVNILKEISTKPALVLYVIDIFDFEGSWLEQLPQFLNHHEIYVIVNKIDILPRDVKMDNVEQFVRDELKERQLAVEKVFLISALKQWETDALVDALIHEFRSRDIYVVGSTNVGKSTFINRIVPPLLKETGMRLFDLPEITTSMYSGTTVEALKIPLDDRTAVYDTPGIIKEERLTEQICPECLQIITPRKRINPRVFQLNEQQTLFLGGLVRIDYVEGAKKSFICYVANDLNVHRTKLENAQTIFDDHHAEMLSPPCVQCGSKFPLEQVVPLQCTDGQELDIVISGLGWVAVKGEGSGKIVIRLPKSAQMRVRESLI